MVQSLELLLDPALDAAVRAEWDALAGAGLPSQARHPGASNAPHVTLAVADALPERADTALGAVAELLPVPVRLGALTVFTGRRAVLARLVVPSRALLDVHAAALDALAGPPGLRRTVLPGRWTPHVTLARGLPPDRVGDAVAAVPGERVTGPAELTGQADRLRRWDGEARRSWLVEPSRPTR